MAQKKSKEEGVGCPVGKFFKDMDVWFTEGKIKWKETIIEGIEKAPTAFIGLFKGKNFGKMRPTKVSKSPMV